VRALGQENVIMRSLVGVIAAAAIATMFVLPADARAKKPKRAAAIQGTAKSNIVAEERRPSDASSFVRSTF